MRRLVLSLGAVIFAMALAAPRAAAANEIYIGGIFDITGGTASVSAPYADGVRDYVRYINEVKGGIKGRKINLVIEDYEYKIPRALDVYKKLLAPGAPSLIHGWGTGDTLALTLKASVDKIPFFSASVSSDLYDGTKNPYNFAVGVTYQDQMRIGLKFVDELFRKEGRRPRIIFAYPDNGFGRAPIEAGKTDAAKYQFEVLKDQLVDLKALNADAEIQYAIDNKADVIFIQSIYPTTNNFGRSAHKLGYKGKIFALNWAFGEAVIAYLGKDAEGIYGTMPFASWYAEDVPGVRLCHEVRKRADPKSAPMPVNYLQAVATTLVIEEALKRAGDDLSGVNVKRAIESIHGFDTQGLTLPVTFNEVRHYGLDAMRVQQIKGGKIVPISDVIKVR